MKNSDMPAMPIELSGFGMPEAHYGLTKLEDFTKAAMQGLLAYGDLYFHSDGRAKLAKDAVDFAEAVLAELEVRK